MAAGLVLSTATLVIISSLLTYFLAKFLRVFFLISKFQGPPSIPIIGNTYDFKTDNRENFLRTQARIDKYREQTGGLLRLWFGPYPTLTIYSAKHMEIILSSSRHIKKGVTYRFIEPWLGLGLLTRCNGQKWFQRRKMLTPTFHFSILRNFLEVFNEQSAIFVQKLERCADEADPVNIFPLVTYCTLDIICATAMGNHINAQGDSDNEYVNAVKSISKLIIQRGKNPFVWHDALFEWTKASTAQKQHLKILHGFTKNVIHDRLQEPPRRLIEDSEDHGISGKRMRVAFLDLLLQMHREDPTFTLEDIREEVDTFMFEGHDTTAAAISWAIFLIGRHPGVQARIHEELDEVFGTSNRLITADDLAQLPYLTCVAKEALRLIPSVSVISRKLEEDIVLDGKVVPNGTTIHLSIYGLHRDPEQFPDPERFDPDRFLPENAHKRHPYAFVPFSAGPRNCIGQRFAMMEDKVILANVLRNFSVESIQTIEETKPTGELIIRPGDGQILVKLKRRK